MSLPKTPFDSQNYLQLNGGKSINLELLKNCLKLKQQGSLFQNKETTEKQSPKDGQRTTQTQASTQVEEKKKGRTRGKWLSVVVLILFACPKLHICLIKTP
jgi:hypothetical protein